MLPWYWVYVLPQSTAVSNPLICLLKISNVPIQVGLDMAVISQNILSSRLSYLQVSPVYCGFDTFLSILIRQAKPGLIILQSTQANM